MEKSIRYVETILFVQRHEFLIRVNMYAQICVYSLGLFY